MLALDDPEIWRFWVHLERLLWVDMKSACSASGIEMNELESITQVLLLGNDIQIDGVAGRYAKCKKQRNHGSKAR